jgi:predicted  nucleic acid-binding Zn-ribbon protein
MLLLVSLLALSPALAQQPQQEDPVITGYRVTLDEANNRYLQYRAQALAMVTRVQQLLVENQQLQAKLKDTEDKLKAAEEKLAPKPPAPTQQGPER